MTTCEEQQIQIPGFTLGAKIWNPKASKPVLCLHGKMDNAASFDFLAPLIPDRQIIAIDYPGTGYSSTYQDGLIPHWKNDSFLLVHLANTLKLEKFDLIAHSLGGLLASALAISQPQRVGKIIFLDILGPTVHFIENATHYIHRDLEIYLNYKQFKRTVYPDLKAAIQDRMKTGNISYQAAQALVERGVKKNETGWSWTFDQRLRCVSATLPLEDEIRAILKAIEAPICLIRAMNGVSYPELVFKERAKCVKHLEMHELPGGHHVHMDNPAPVANIVNSYLA